MAKAEDMSFERVQFHFLQQAINVSTPLTLFALPLGGVKNTRLEHRNMLDKLLGQLEGLQKRLDEKTDKNSVPDEQLLALKETLGQDALYVRHRLSLDDGFWGDFLTSSHICSDQAINRSHKNCSRAVMSFKQMRILLDNPEFGFVETALREWGFLVLDFGDSGFTAVTSKKDVPLVAGLLHDQWRVAQFDVFGVDAFTRDDPSSVDRIMGNSFRLLFRQPGLKKAAATTPNAKEVMTQWFLRLMDYMEYLESKLQPQGPPVKGTAWADKCQIVLWMYEWNAAVDYDEQPRQKQHRRKWNDS